MNKLMYYYILELSLVGVLYLIGQFAQSKSRAYQTEYKWVIGDIKYYVDMHKFELIFLYIMLFILYLIPGINIMVVFGRLICTMDTAKMRYFSNCVISRMKPHVNKNYPNLYNQVKLAGNIAEEDYYMYTIKLVVVLHKDEDE